MPTTSLERVNDTNHGPVIKIGYAVRLHYFRLFFRSRYNMYDRFPHGK